MKKKTLPQLKKILWKHFSVFIRQRDSNSNGYGNCSTCGVHKHWKELQAGHFVSRAELSVCFDERNVHIQCARCNGFRGGEQFIMSIYIDGKYGIGTSDELQYLRHQPSKFSRTDYVEMIEKYKQINKENGN